MEPEMALGSCLAFGPWCLVLVCYLVLAVWYFMARRQAEPDGNETHPVTLIALARNGLDRPRRDV